MKIVHYDLFAGIGGFSLALDNIFNDYERQHIFCEWESFPTAVLKKNWPQGVFYGDIADLVADTDRQRREGVSGEDEGRLRQSSGEVSDKEQEVGETTTDTEHVGKSRAEVIGENSSSQSKSQTGEKLSFNELERGGGLRGKKTRRLTVLTGGFPCQPFSVAGRRKGTADDRYLWPQMFRVIQNVRPDWVIAENVRGLVTWNEGMVLETVCADLESEGYEVQPFIIPAVAIGAPHRRDRVWIVANNKSTRAGQDISGIRGLSERHNQGERRERDTAITPNNRSARLEEAWAEQQTAGDRGEGTRLTPNPRQQLREQRSGEGMEADTTIGTNSTEANQREREYTWQDDWREVAFATCHDRVDDGLSPRMVRLPNGTKISHAKWRKEALKAYGNAIVPAVAEEIFRAIKEAKKL